MSDQTALEPPDLASVVRHYVGVIRPRLWLVGACAGAFLLMGLVYLALAERLYEATGRVLIVPHDTRPLGAAGDEETNHLEAPENFIPTQMAILQSQSVVGRAVAALGPDRLPTLTRATHSREVPVLTRRAIGYLKVSRPDKFALHVAIDYRAASPEEAIEFVNSVIKSYEGFLEEKYRDGNHEAVSRIGKAHDELSRQVAVLEANYLAFQQAHPHLLELVKDEAGHPVLGNRLHELERAANEAGLKALRLKSQLALGRKLAEQGTELWSIAFAISQIGGDPGTSLATQLSGPNQATSSDYIRQLVKEQQELSAVHGANFSKVRDLQTQIAEAEQRANDSAVHLDKGKVRQLLSSIELSLAAVEQFHVEITRQYHEELEQSKKLLADVARGRELRTNLERQKALFATIVDQLKRAELGGESGGVRAQTIEPAASSYAPVAPKVSLTLAMALLMGLGLGLASALAADALDERVRSLAELRETTGLEVLGTVPRLTGDQLLAAGRSGLLCQQLPQSQPAEDFRALRTKVEALRRERDLQVLLVTSPTVNDGKSSSSSNLAISLAHAGRRVLLVDADLRRPSQHTNFDLRPCPGLSHVIKDVVPFHRAVQRTNIDHLEVLTAGSDISNPAELLASPRVAALFAEARRHYDVIVVDSSPLLLVTDPSILAPLADGVILVVDGARIRARDAVRAAAMLDDLRASTLGILVNGFNNRWRHSSRDHYAYDLAGRPVEHEDDEALALAIALNGNGNSHGNGDGHRTRDSSFPGSRRGKRNRKPRNRP